MVEGAEMRVALAVSIMVVSIVPARHVRGQDKPSVVRYEPPAYYTTYSASHLPGISIRSGDTVRMNTAGSGSTGPGVVPAPIYVHGADKGDVLAIRVLRIQVAEKAWSARALQLDWFTTDFARAAVDPPGDVWSWTLDAAAGVARLDTTCQGCTGPSYRRMNELRVSLRPHLGNIGVAPSGERAIDAPEAGAYGGNLDYPGIEAGVTLYLPVYHPGGLLSVAGDVHAAQGDGELVCSGLETSAEVEFTVSVIHGPSAKQDRLTQVRAENATHLMAFGTAADLKQALRIANTNLAEWLQQEYGVRSGELGMFLGTLLELDIANVCGEQTTVVAKVRKERLLRLP